VTPAEALRFAGAGARGSCRLAAEAPGALAGLVAGEHVSRMRIGVPREREEGERRVALVPESVEQLAEDGFEVLVEAGAGGEWRPDGAYEEAGATLVENAEELYAQADVVLKVRPPAEDELEHVREGAVLASMFDPEAERELLERLAERGATTLSMVAMPRTGRAQSMDALSSMSSIAGYAGVLLAAGEAGRYLPTRSARTRARGGSRLGSRRPARPSRRLRAASARAGGRRRERRRGPG
jgi:hypothetical protein